MCEMHPHCRKATRYGCTGKILIAPDECVTRQSLHRDSILCSGKDRDPGIIIFIVNKYFLQLSTSIVPT